MNSEANERIVLVPLPESFVKALVKIHASMDEELLETLESNVAKRRPLFPAGCLGESSGATLPPIRKYAAEFLGSRFTAWTLPEVFAEIVDMTAEVAPEALTKLSRMSARTRRFVSHKPEAIHPGNKRLPVMQTSSGWWISKNIGQDDLIRALRALCNAADITFGKDLKFSMHNQPN